MPRALKGIADVWLVLGLILLFSVFSRGATTSGNHKNSLGVIQYQDNPLTYKEGAVVGLSWASSGGGNSFGVNVRIQPRGTFALFTEEILFCGDPSEKFSQMHNPMVLAYETVDHKTISGVGCHELKSVDEVVGKELPQ